jgi:hypothetical protein
MSLADIAQGLTRSLDRSTAMLRQLLGGLEERRTAWISARPTVTMAATQQLEQLASSLADEESQRQQMLDRARDLLPTTAGRSTARRHVNISILLPALPRHLAEPLKKASATARSIAQQVRVEQAMGDRLLRFSQNMHDRLMGNLVQDIDQQRNDVGSYDRAARRLSNALGSTGQSTGNLVDGRM